MTLVLSEASSGVIGGAILVLTVLAVCVKVCIDSSCRHVSGCQSSVDLVHLGKFVPDVQIKLLACLVANIGESEDFGLISKIGGVWQRHQLVIGWDPIAIGETTLSSSDRFCGESLNVQGLVETANGVKGEAKLLAHEA